MTPQPMRAALVSAKSESIFTTAASGMVEMEAKVETPA
jgi:hypothetical protein